MLIKGLSSADDMWCSNMAAHASLALTWDYVVQYVLFPIDIHEDDLVRSLQQMMRARRGGWDIIVFAMRGHVFEGFHAIEEIFNTCIQENAKIPTLLFQWDINTAPLWQVLMRARSLH